jgi:hypothetical protein
MGRFRLFALALLCAAGVAGVLAAGGFAAKTATTAASAPQGTIPWIPSDGQDEDGAYVDPSRPSLHVHVYEHWAGSVQSTNLEPGLINCPSACRRNIEPGAKITLSETPTGVGYTFDHWSGAECEAPTTQTTQTCTITMPSSGELEVVAHYSGQYEEPAPVHTGPSCGELLQEVKDQCEGSSLCELVGYIYTITRREGCSPSPLD